LNPRMWPWFTTRFDRVLNRRLLLHQLAPLLRALPEPPVAVTTLPIVADLIGPLPVRRWVYYCVDDFGQWPGLDGATLAALEETVVRRADVLIAVSDHLRDRLAGLGRDAHLLTHGTDLDFWSRPAAGPPAVLDGLERPLVVFWGLLDRRMDLEFVRRLAADLDGGTVVLAGPENEPDPALKALPRVVATGVLPFADLPRLAREAAVLVMPYADLPVTRAMQPLKLKEYLATGRPVVVRDLPANRAWADALDLAATPDVFSRVVRERLRTGLPADQAQARQCLAHESWAEKARAFSSIVMSDE
jgi:glycosyltransferase involved in cell wall biosynthesis